MKIVMEYKFLDCNTHAIFMPNSTYNFLQTFQALKVIHFNGKVRAHIVFFEPPKEDSLDQDWLKPGLAKVEYKKLAPYTQQKLN